MRIRDIFQEDIERTVEEVIKVDQVNEAVVYEELREYVPTAAIQRHFTAAGLGGAVDGQWVGDFGQSGRFWLDDGCSISWDVEMDLVRRVPIRLGIGGVDGFA